MPRREESNAGEADLTLALFCDVEWGPDSTKFKIDNAKFKRDVACTDKQNPKFAEFNANNSESPRAIEQREIRESNQATLCKNKKDPKETPFGAGAIECMRDAAKSDNKEFRLGRPCRGSEAPALA